MRNGMQLSIQMVSSKHLWYFPTCFPFLIFKAQPHNFSPVIVTMPCTQKRTHMHILTAPKQATFIKSRDKMRKSYLSTICTSNGGTEVRRWTQLSGKQSDWVVQGDWKLGKSKPVTPALRRQWQEDYNFKENKSQLHSKFKIGFGSVMKTEVDGGGREGEIQREIIPSSLKTRTHFLEE